MLIKIVESIILIDLRKISEYVDLSELLFQYFFIDFYLLCLQLCSTPPWHLNIGPCQTSGLAAAVAKRPGRCETAFERGYIDSYVKR